MQGSLYSFEDSLSSLFQNFTNLCNTLYAEHSFKKTQLVAKLCSTVLAKK